MTIAAVYLRVSSDRSGEEEAVERQGEDCARLAAARGWPVGGTFIDNDTSAAGKVVRPGFDALVAEIDAGNVDAVVAWAWDRLTRNRRDELRLIEACEKHGTRITLVRGADLDLSTPAGSQMADFMASAARAEIRIKGDRQRRAQQQRAEKGRPAKGIRPTGYTLAGEVIEDEAVLIRRIFDQFTAGGTLKGTAAQLERDGIVTRRGGRWSSSSVGSMLRNGRYAGRSIYKGADVGAATWPAIVSEAQFAAAQARLQDPSRKTRGVDTARKHLGSGLYYCTCGLRVRSSSGLGNGMNRYTCRTTCHYRSAGPVDAYVLAVIRGRLALPDLRELLVKPADESRLAELSGERMDLRHRLTTVEADYDAGLIDGIRLRAATDRAQARLAAIRTEESKLLAHSGPGAVLAAEKPVEAFDAADLAIQQRVVDSLAVVTLSSGKHGSRAFDPDTVTLAWR